MGLFKRRKNNDDVVTHDVPMSTIARWYLYDTDITEDVNGLAELIGLTPISEEGESKEKEESEARVDALHNIFPFLEMMSGLSAESLVMLHVKQIMNETSEEEQEALVKDFKNMQTVYRAVALSTLIGTFSIAINLGLINTDALKSEVLDMESLDDEF